MKIKIIEEVKIVSVKIEDGKKTFSIKKCNTFLGSDFYITLLRKEDDITFVKKPSNSVMTELVKAAFNISAEEKIKINY
jgi:hypothetical protein